ncbi:hypothetical protein BDV59DRAFT_193477 [Aspergillus ambiguus]|uniref:cytochrome b561 domain-containing protein n=1 Tax=Aspergillus ambiguus TaxID=176160 RepID=UPI003CCE0806
MNTTAYVPHLWFWSDVIYQDLHLVPKFAAAHGAIMSVVFVVIFPVGAILLRVPRSEKSASIHIACQVLGVALMIAGLATGVRVGDITGQLHNNAHTILGTVVVVFMLIQPIIGFYHHRQFLSTQMTSSWTYVHVWQGRMFLLIGIINGGLGLRLAANTRVGEIVYGVSAGVFAVGFITVAILRGGLKLEKKAKQPEVAEAVT